MAFSQNFGRFGYGSLPIPGFSLDRKGFHARYGSADTLRFLSPCPVFLPTSVSEFGETITMNGGPGSPSKARISLLSPGFSLYFEAGMSLHISSPASPFLSWKEGSVTENVPTPDVSWSVLSFRDSQPPIVFAFPAGPTSLTITGSSSDWTIRTSKKFHGWVRIGLPNGVEPMRASTASTLGKLSLAVAKQQSFWLAPTPTLRKQEVVGDETGVDAVWTFDMAGALVPSALQLAALGGYPVKILSKTHSVDPGTDEGPMAVMDGPELRVHFPVRAIHHGRSLAIGEPTVTPLASASYRDVQSVFSLALEGLTATSDSQTAKLSEDTLAEFLAQADYVKEPATKQMLPFTEDGAGMDLVAAHSLLMEAIACATAKDDVNSLLATLEVRRDWNTWLPTTENEALRRRTAALASMAGALGRRPDSRLQGAMYEAGLAADRALVTWRSKRAIESPSSSKTEPILGLRQAIFTLAGEPAIGYDYAKVLLSPLKTTGRLSLVLDKDAARFAMTWSVVDANATSFELLSTPALALTARTNIRRLEIASIAGGIRVVTAPDTAGICQALAKFDVKGLAVPKLVPPPNYSE